MGFYSGKPGKSFQISKIFTSKEDMDKEAEDSLRPNDSLENYWTAIEVPVNGFVIISNPNDNEYEYNGKIFIKNFDGTNYSYSQVGSIGGVIPHIDANGLWSVDPNNASSAVGTRAVAKEIELEIETNREIAPLALLYREQSILDKENNIIEPGSTEKPIYGLANLSEKYSYTEEAGWQPNLEGIFIKVYKSNSLGEFIYDENNEPSYYNSAQDGYFLFSTESAAKEWQVYQRYQPSFKTDWLKWRYIGEEWHDLFEITGLINIETYSQQALMAMSSAEASYNKTEKLANDIELVKIDYDKISTKLDENIGYAEGYANEAKSAVEDIRLALEDFREENKNPELSLLSTEIEQSRASFGFLNQRLELMPYQFDTIAEMQKATQLSIGDRIFTFGRDTIGDGDSSKLFEIFDPNDKRLEEIIEGSETEENPEGEKKIAEQYPVNGGQQIAGLLTIFSGYGSGGGGGAGVPTISVTGSDAGFSVKEGETITLEYYWTGPTAGTATLFIKDTKDSKVVDYYDTSKIYSLGVPINKFGTGSVTLQPSKGEHNYTFYIIDRAQVYSNEVKVKVVAGSMSLSVDLPDGKTFSATSAINYNFTVNTIYSKYSVLNYTITQNGQLYDAGEIVSSNATIGVQSIRLPIKTSTQSIGQGQFKITVYAYVQDDPSIVTNTITRNFIIMEENVIYLTTSFDGDATPGYQGDPVSIPLQLIYVGGSDFIIEGRYSTSPDFAWEDGIPTTPPSTTKDREGSLTYSITFQDIGTYYVKFKASSSAVTAIGFSETIKINIEEKISKYPLQEENLVIHYSARKGQTNGANKHVWENISKIEKDPDLNATLKGFNYSSNGWETKNINGAETPTGYLHCSGKSYVSIPYQFYNKITPTQGGTFEIVFKAVDIASDQIIYSMTLAEGFGFYIYKEKVVLNIPEVGATNITAYYNIKGVEEKDEPCHIALTLDPVNRYAKIYCNGVLSRAIADFNYNPILSVLNTTSYINRGELNSNPQYGIVKVDCVRFYQTCLTDTQIVRNYIYNLRDEKLQAKLWTKNYLDSDDDNQLPTEIPYMAFYLNKNDWAMMDKDNYKPKIYVEYHDPNPPEGNEAHKQWEKVQCAWQGTSSIAYPVKNFKIKLREKYKLKGDKYSLEEKTFCLKADYMDSSHCHNTGTANFIHSTGLLSNYSLTPAQSKELNISVADGYKGLNNLPSTDLDGNELIKPKPVELKTRTCIDGHPIALYIYLETDESAADENRAQKDRQYESPLYWGIYNFNLDKGSTDSFGLRRDEDDFQNVTSFEIAANSSYSAGGFRALRFVKKINAEEYGWTRWNVGFTPIDSTNAYEVNLNDGAFLNIIKAKSNGEILYEIRNIEFDYELNGKNKHFIGVYNATLNNIYGVTDENDKYLENGTLNPNGTYIALYKYDSVKNTLFLDENQTPVILGYYNYNIPGWSYNVPLESEIYELKNSWMLYGDYGEATEENLPQNAIKLSAANESNKFSYVILKDPEDISAKYNYYTSDFELRYPDADIYLTYQDKPNKLYWKEYDKIIALAEWVDYVGIDKLEHFTNEFKTHFDQDTLVNYYLTLMTTGMIDNFGKNLMINTWGYDKNGEIPYQIFIDDKGNIYHKVWKFISKWDEDEEYYLDDGNYQYGLMDINHPIETEFGIKYKVYATNEEYSELGELIEEADFGGVTDDRITGWYHEIDISKIIWYTHFYDLDSSLGVNNTGILSFGPSIEMNDDFYINIENQKVSNAPFNTSNSALWQQVVNNLHPYIKNRFLELSQLGSIYTIDNFKKYYYQDIIDIMGIRMYNADSFPKYLSREAIKCIINGAITYVYPNSFDHLALGNDWQRISKWLERRLRYLTSMFEADQEKKGSFSFRLEQPTLAYTFQIECYEPYYMNLSFKNGSPPVSIRVAGFNETIIKTAPSASGASDQEIFINPPDNIKSIKEISQPKSLGFSTVFLNGATRLLSIDLSNSQGLTEISLNPDQILLTKSINVSNCPNLKAAFSGAQFPYLEYINTTGSGTNTSFTFNPNGGQIETAILEANGLALNIIDHSDLKNLTIQLTYDKPPTEQNVNINHNGKYSVINLDNCSNPDFVFNVRGKYLDENNNWIEVPTQIFDNFISNYGIFSLFSRVQNLTIRNSLKNILEIEQLQPNGELLTVKEFVLSLPRLKKLELIKTDFDKIALVSSSIDYDGQTIFVGYPGWGGNPEVVSSNGIYTFTGDSNYIAEKAEGIIGDSAIKELEFRGPYPSDKLPSNSLPTPGKFEFPWRIYLGTMPKLQRLKFNTTSVSPKGIIYDANGINGDQYYLTRLTSVNSDIWTPARFELILPPPPNENEITKDYKGLEMIYFGPGVSNVDFTAIRQKDTNLGEYYIEDNSFNLKSVYNWPKEYFETITTGTSNTPIGKVYFHPFRGVDLRGYKDLAINFHGLINIVGIAGMNSLSVPNIINNFGENCFSGFFSNCKKLQVFHSAEKIEEGIIGKKPDIYQYEKWDFSDWFSTTLGKNFKNISKFFQNCQSLTDTSYINGILKPINSTNFYVENTSLMFEGCSNLENININWPNINSTIHNIEGMFQNCYRYNEKEKKEYGLETVEIIIKGIDVKQEKYLKSLKNLFSGCAKLKEQSIILLTDSSPVGSAFKYIEDVSEMYSMCSSLEFVNYNLTFNDLGIESNEIDVFNFDNLKVATNWFNGCKALKEIKFPSVINFTKLENCSAAFGDCEKLETIFVDSQIKLYDSKQSIEDLVMTQFLANCKSLTSIGGLANIDGTRIIAIDGMFTNNLQLTGELDLSNWIFDITEATYDKNGNLLTEEKANRYVATNALFSGCSGLTSIKLPKIYTNNLVSMFIKCSNLKTLDVSPIIPEKQILADGTRIGPDNFSYIFSECSQLTSDSFTGYQNWNVKYGSTFSNMFKQCVKLTELDLSNWKITHSNMDVTIDSMFQECVSLKNIKGLNSLFGTFDDVLNRVEEKYNPNYFSTEGVVGLFKGCSNLLLGQNENNIASWARMAVKISTMKEMFQGCQKLTDLKLVFARGVIDPTTETASIPPSESLYWGSNKSFNGDCKFEALSEFAGMCTSCIKLKQFDYFDSGINKVDYIKDVQDQYIYPSNLSDIVAGCTSLTKFVFLMTGLGMHNLVNDMSTAFNGCSKLTSIVFPSRTEKNLGIKKNLNFIEIGATESDWRNQLAREIPTWLYDFASNQTPPVAEWHEGKLTLPAAAENWEIVSPGSNFEASMIALGWDVVIPESANI